MTKRNVIEILTQLEVVRFQILQTPDWNGGSYPEVRINKGCLGDDELEDYQYINYDGDATDIVRHLNKEISGFRYSNLNDYHPGEDYSITLRDAVKMAFYEYLV